MFFVKPFYMAVGAGDARAAMSALAGATITTGALNLLEPFADAFRASNPLMMSHKFLRIIESGRYSIEGVSNESLDSIRDRFANPVLEISPENLQSMAALIHKSSSFSARHFRSPEAILIEVRQAIGVVVDEGSLECNEASDRINSLKEGIIDSIEQKLEDLNIGSYNSDGFGEDYFSAPDNCDEILEEASRIIDEAIRDQWSTERLVDSLGDIPVIVDQEDYNVPEFISFYPEEAKKTLADTLVLRGGLFSGLLQRITTHL